VVSGLLVLGGLVAAVAPSAVAKAPPAKKPNRPAAKPSLRTEAVQSFPQVAEIDRQIEAQWKANRITPSTRASDYEFIRRATLDIIGRIAKVDEIARFLKDPAGTRRALLIDRLLDSPEYTENWANIWSVWLLSRSSRRDRGGHQVYREQLQVWLEEQFDQKGFGWDKIASDLLTATGETNENGAVNYLLSHLGEPKPGHLARDEGRFDFVPVTSRTARLFLGLQIQCAQCHDHPHNPQWRQKHFWGLNAFFRQVEREGRMMNNNMMDLPKLELRDNSGLNVTNAVFFENAKSAVITSTRPVFLDGTKLGRQPGKTRRQELAEFLVKSDYFAKAYVNRMWAHFFGRGLTRNGRDFDDFGEHNPETHPLTEEAAARLKAKHPERFKDQEPTLLDYVAEEFRSSPANHDPRALVRWICNSRAYSLTSVANGTIEVDPGEAAKTGDKKAAPKKRTAANDHADAEPFFSRMALKAMSPEQLFASLWVSTYANPHAVRRRTKNDQKRLQDDWQRKLTVSFGDDEGNEASFNGTVVQALMLMNGREINEAIEDKQGPVPVALYRAARRGLPGMVDELYLATLNRRATAAELREIGSGIRLVMGTKDAREKAGQDLLWAILNSSEFILNH
jgi:hypothetical protein